MKELCRITVVLTSDRKIHVRGDGVLMEREGAMILRKAAQVVAANSNKMKVVRPKLVEPWNANKQKSDA